jgi:hypothetical protein
VCNSRMQRGTKKKGDVGEYSSTNSRFRVPSAAGSADCESMVEEVLF